MRSLDILCSSLMNAQRAHKLLVSVPYSGFAWSFAQILASEGYIRGLRRDGRQLKVLLRYTEDQPAIRGLQRVSRSSKRVYMRASQVYKPLQGLGTLVLSTSQGLVCDRDARRLHLGGEVLCQVW
jgi:small subunit ribosomal protein S8